jgi:arsenate reductase
VARIYHNPACGTSRNTLALMRHAGVEPEVVEYLGDPPTPSRLRELAVAAGIPVRGLLREKEREFVALGLDDPSVPDEVLLAAMHANPILIQRPLVETEAGVRLCRPSERVLDILPAVTRYFAKEDGEVVIDAEGRRVV